MDNALRVPTRDPVVRRGHPVLILVLMDNALRVTSRQCERQGGLPVLILVLMDNALREDPFILRPSLGRSLNPCSNGQCSTSSDCATMRVSPAGVLILVLMDNALRCPKRNVVGDHHGLNPCSAGIA